MWSLPEQYELFADPHSRLVHELRATGARPEPGPIRAVIQGIGAALPSQLVTNDEIAQRLGVSADWIERRTGIRSRWRAGDGETVTGLATRAGAVALATAEIDAADLDLVLVATLCPDDITPNAAPQVAHKLGAKRAGAIDIGAACTGFVAALTLAAGQIESGRARNVLVIGSELLSRHTDHDDRSTAALFGDGAGALLLAARQAPPSDIEPHGVGASVLGADGSAARSIIAPRETGVLRMDGHDTFKRAVRTLAANAVDAVVANGLDLDEIDLFVFHQANGRILTAVTEALELDPARVVNAIGELGNTSAASIPLALAEAHLQCRLNPGDRILLGAVGAGFTWAATVVVWGKGCAS